MRRRTFGLAYAILAGTALMLAGCSSSSDGGIMSSGGAAPACSDQTGNRFVDCGNGTVTDTQTGLIWLKNASCLGFTGFDAANQLAADLGEGTHAACNLTDGSSPGDWHLPSLQDSTGAVCAFDDATCEFTAMFKPACAAPFVPDTTGSGCWSEDDPFSGLQMRMYWSSTPFASNADFAWLARLDIANVTAASVTHDHYVWPVRSGS